MKVINVAYVRNHDYEKALTSRTYAYKTELDLKEGDIVFVPTGKDNTPKRTIVVSVEGDKEFPFPVKVVGVEELLHTISVLSEKVAGLDKEEEIKEEVATDYFQI